MAKNQGWNTIGFFLGWGVCAGLGTAAYNTFERAEALKDRTYQSAEPLGWTVDRLEMMGRFALGQDDAFKNAIRKDPSDYASGMAVADLELLLSGIGMLVSSISFRGLADLGSR